MKIFKGKFKVVCTMVLIIALYVAIIYCVCTYPSIKLIAKYILFGYMMLLAIIFLLGNISELFSQEASQLFANIFWHMAWLCLIFVPIGCAVIFK